MRERALEVADVSSGVLRAHEQVRDELRRVDTKATTLLSVVGMALAVGKYNRLKHAVTLIIVGAVVLAVALVLAALA